MTSRSVRVNVADGVDAREMPCPDGCEHRGRRHVHLEAASDGSGQIWGVDDEGDLNLLDPWDLQRDAAVRSPLHGWPLRHEPNRELRRLLWSPRYERPVLPRGCYDASFGPVHVKPGCRCPR